MRLGSGLVMQAMAYGLTYPRKVVNLCAECRETKRRRLRFNLPNQSPKQLLSRCEARIQTFNIRCTIGATAGATRSAPGTTCLHLAICLCSLYRRIA